MLRYSPWGCFLPCEFPNNLKFSQDGDLSNFGYNEAFQYRYRILAAGESRTAYACQAQVEQSARSWSHFCFLALHVGEVLSCRVQFDSRLNLLPHFLRPYGFWALWLCRWSSNSSFLGKVFLHSGHLSIFSLMWIPSWRLRWEFWRKFFPHWEQEYGFSPVWIRSCLLRFVLWLKLFPQWLQS